MTIYSQHANRGKVQILATYRGPAGVMSSTVTSVDDATLAEPIVAALNRVSACATVPVSVWDERGRRFGSYPKDHLAALTDRNARQGLIEGTHSLWYEQAMMLLHRALADLDTAVAAVPAPVRVERSCSSMFSRSVMIRTTKMRTGTFSTSRRRCRTASGGGKTGTSRFADGFRTVRKLDCARSEPPALSEIVRLLNCSDGQSDVQAAWAKTAVGEALTGTAFVVTKRYED